MFTATPELMSKYGEMINWQNEFIFAPWILDSMDIYITELDDTSAKMTLSCHDDLYRKFPPPITEKHLCGQAVMAVADSVLVFPVLAGVGLGKHLTTLDLNTQFLRPVTTEKVTIEVTIIHHGRRTVRGVVNILDSNQKLCASSMVCYMYVNKE